MMTVSEALRGTWQAVRLEAGKPAGYYHRRVPLQISLPAYAGIVQPDSVRRLSFLADSSAVKGHSLRHETRGYRVDLESSPPGHSSSTYIHITAKSDAFGELFAVLATDVLDQWGRHNQYGPAVEAVQRRLEHWRRFFQRTGEGLTREEHIGLYAELCFLEAILAAGIQPDDAVRGWQGPLGTNQDYLFGTAAVEVKATAGNNSDSVRISSERQLDSVGLESLYLCHMAFDFRENTGRTLSGLVAMLSERLGAASQLALFNYENCLLAAGFSPMVSNPYDTYGFTERKRMCFQLREGFPRLTEYLLPSGVSEVSYALNLATCSAYQVQLGALIEAIINGVAHA